MKKECSQKQSLKKWVVLFGAGIASFMTGCCCFGGCGGKIPAPTVLYDDDNMTEYINQEDESTRKCLHAVHWFGIGAISCTMIPLCCGYCCGCCGLVTPAEAIGCD